MCHSNAKEFHAWFCGQPEFGGTILAGGFRIPDAQWLDGFRPDHVEYSNRVDTVANKVMYPYRLNYMSLYNAVCSNPLFLGSK